MTCTCPDCGATYSGTGGGHCRSGCHRTFTSDRAAEAHRVGEFGVGRHCIDVATTEGWRETSRGWTNRPEMPRAVLLQRLRSDETPELDLEYPQVS